MQVAAGDLPPVEKRLPEQPQVVEPVEEIGQYGGTAHLFALSNSPRCPADAAYVTGFEPLLRIAPDCKTPIANVAKAWEFSEDFRDITFYLHKGIRWSDGVEFTANDIMFWYEDIFLNEKLTPVKGANLCVNGKPMKVEKVDDYTIRVHFDNPYPVVLLLLGWYGGVEMVRYPKHHLKQFHIKYNPEANELAKKNGFELWNQYFRDRSSVWGGVSATVGLPTLNAFMCVERTSNHFLYERNPYYWKIDTEGNQLPYIDKLFTKIVDKEVYTGKIFSGESDFAARGTTFAEYPLYKKYAEENDYRVYLWTTTWSAVAGIQCNQTHKDPVLRKVFRDVRFRRALSLGIDREEINEVVFSGLGVPCQATVLPSLDYYEDRFAEAYAEYDPEEANRLLDEMGLKWDKNHEYRLFPDGRRLAWQVEHSGGPGINPIVELVREQWKEIGCQVALKEQPGELLQARASSNEMDMEVFIVDTADEIYFTFAPKYFIPVTTGWDTTWGVEWAYWYQTEGEKGEEPPQKIKDLYTWWDKMKFSPNKEDRVEAARQILASQAENLWTIGTVGRAPFPYVIKNHFRNVPEHSYHGYGWYYTMPVHPEQFFIKQK
jgi:peptide/nickel transport system substrate-binding protein